jgi:hypothetical protein
MIEKKNLERLFQEKFKDFETTPSEEVWNTIEARLQEKKKRRAIPFWWKFSGVAALLTLGTLGTLLYLNQNNLHSPEINQPNVVHQEAQPVDEIANETNSITIPNEVASETILIDPKKNGNSSGSTTTEHSSTVFPRSEVVENSKKSKHNPTRKENNNALTPLQNNANTSGVVENNETKDIDLNSGVTKETFLKNKSEISATERRVSDSPSNTLLPLSVLDSITMITVIEETKALENLLHPEDKTKEIVASNTTKWQIVPSLAPVFFNSISDGSPIDTQFAQNDKSYENSLSIGVGINYSIDSKWTFKSGIHKIDLSYNTNDVSFFADLSAKGITTITQNNPQAMIGIVNVATLQPTELIGTYIQTQNQGGINQKFGYVEVPMEISYQLVDSKVKMSIIGGMSTFFLTENEVSVVSQGYKHTFGKANNLNSVHFSSNVGVGFQYVIWRNLQLSVEPKLKYQLNTFSSDAGNFKPYFIGIYSGISFSF